MRRALGLAAAWLLVVATAADVYPPRPHVKAAAPTLAQQRRRLKSLAPVPAPKRPPSKKSPSPSSSDTTKVPTVFPTPAVPTVAPTLVPTLSPAVPPVTAQPSTAEPSSSTGSPTVAPITTSQPAVAALGTYEIALVPFVLTVGWTASYVAVDGLTQDLQQGLSAHLQAFFSAAFDRLTLQGAEQEVSNRQLAESHTNHADISFTGTAVFSQAVAEAQVWEQQLAFLSQYDTLPNDTADLEEIRLPETGEILVTIDEEEDPDTPRGTGDQFQDDEEITGQATTSFSSFGTYVGAAVGGLSLAVLAAVFALRRSGRRLDSHHDLKIKPTMCDDSIDPSDLGSSPASSTDREVESSGRGLVLLATPPKSLGNASDLEMAGNNSPSGVWTEDQSSLMTSGILTSVAEEKLQDLIAEAGDENFDISLHSQLTHDYDDEFAAVAVNQPHQPVDPQVYSQWVSPLIRQMDASARDCCFNGGTRNVMDTTIPLEEGTEMLALEPAAAATTFGQQDLAVAVLGGKSKLEDSSLISPTTVCSTSVSNLFRTNFPLDESVDENPSDESVPENPDEEEDDDDDDPLRAYSTKYQSPYVRPTQSAVDQSVDSSINLSQQASFMTDDTGCDLLEKAVRDVGMWSAEPQNTEETAYQVSTYMHQVRREAKESQQQQQHLDNKQVTL
jgi:hypothetical protein